METRAEHCISSSQLEFSVVVKDSIRLDKYLQGIFKPFSLNELKKFCNGNAVLINGIAGRAGKYLHYGDLITLLRLPQKILPGILPGDKLILPLCIHRETDQILIVEKLAGMHSVRHKEDEEVTLADQLAAYLPEIIYAGREFKESGLVQRLDYYTSGIIVAAKDRKTWEILHHEFISGGVFKEYLALVEGEFPEGRHEINYAVSVPKNNKRVVPLKHDKVMKNACLDNCFAVTTQVERVESYVAQEKKFSLVKASSLRTVRHQIRAHLAAYGYPLVGDTLYGSNTSLANLAIIPNRKSGFYLHACTVKGLSKNSPYKQTLKGVCQNVVRH